MKKEIPLGYPSDLSNEELSNLIKEYSVGATNASRHANSATPPMYWSEIAQLGLAELQNRTIEKLNSTITDLKNENNEQSKINKRLNRITIFLSIVVIILAIITVIYAYIDYKSDKDWQKEQIFELEKINYNLKEFIDMNKKNYINLNDSIKNE